MKNYFSLFLLLICSTSIIITSSKNNVISSYSASDCEADQFRIQMFSENQPTTESLRDSISLKVKNGNSGLNDVNFIDGTTIRLQNISIKSLNGENKTLTKENNGLNRQILDLKRKLSDNERLISKQSSNCYFASQYFLYGLVIGAGLALAVTDQNECYPK